MAKANFEACLQVVLAHEGGYVDHKDDPGGATNRGITRRTLADWRGVSPYWDLPKSEVQKLGLDETRRIYRARYWDAVAGDELAAGVDLAVFDFAVNSGPPRAACYLQAELGTAQDGSVGPLTLAALDSVMASGGGQALIRRLSARRLAFLKSLSIFSVFGRGWTRRVAETEASARAMCAGNSSTSPTKGHTRMNILDGYKTYIVGGLMLLSALAQMAGVELPGFEGQSAMQLLMEGLAVMFLRKGIKTDTTV